MAGRHKDFPGGKDRIFDGRPDGKTRRITTQVGNEMVQTGKSMPDWLAGWTLVRDRMRRELGDAVFDAWIGPLSLESWDGDDLKIGAAKPFVRNWVANHYVARLEKAFRVEGFAPAGLSIVVSAAPAPQIAAAVPREAAPVAE